MYMSGMENQALKLSVYQMILTVLGFCALVPSFGLVGAAWTISASVVFINLAELYVARKKIGLRWSNARYWRWIVPASVSVAVAIALNQFGPAQVGVALLGAYVLLLYALFHVLSFAQGIHDDDRDLFLHLRAQLHLARLGAQ